VAAHGAHVSSADLERAVRRLTERYERSGRWFGEDSVVSDLGRRGTVSVIELAKRMGATLDQLPALTDFNDAVTHLREAGWTEFLERFARENIASEAIPDAAEAAFWRARLQRFFAENPELEEFRGRSHERLIEEFKELDRRLVQAATDRIIAACNARRPSPVAMKGSEVGLLTHEAKKRRRHLPVRKLLGRLPTVLPRLKPCLMMSPLAVSHYLSPDHRFDLVIFDEASQVPPWDAINCIYRGEQVVVAGDSKQLPPTSFFELADPDSTEEEDDGNEPGAPREELMESILDACATVLPEESLRWHYRSRHEHLIAFSNHRFYGNSLVTFPAPLLEAPDLGVQFVHVPDGVYDRGGSRTNQVEARRVAERVCELLEEDSSRSLGVVTFNFAQTEAVLDELDRLLVERPHLEQYFDHDGEQEEVFVKNLESVQGDERDVILFSIGYGRDQHGKFYMGFGPLNREGGHRRLNVAVTRARKRVEVFSSVRAKDFQLGERASVGARALQAYLDFAERGPRALAEEVEALGGDYESPFEEAVAAAVRDLGYQVIPQVGVGGFRIDLGVVDPAAPGRFVLGIECDGATYHSTPTARDRDRLRQAVLEGLGWRIHRIWSWDWVRERPTEVKRLKIAIEHAIAAREDPHPSARQGTATREEDVGVTRREVEVAVHEIRGPEEALGLPWVEPYEVADLSGFGTHLAFHEPDNRSTLHKALRALVRVEAPIHRDYAIKRLADAQGIKRRGSRVTGTGRNIIQSAVRKGRIELRGDFIWLPEQELTKVRVPRPGDPATRREIGDIPPEEISLAFKHLMVASVPDDLEALVQQVARVFGFDRTGSSIQEALMSQLRALINGPTRGS
jgi:very-short-patch-repair endonuclease